VAEEQGNCRHIVGWVTRLLDQTLSPSMRVSTQPELKVNVLLVDDHRSASLEATGQPRSKSGEGQFG